MYWSTSYPCVIVSTQAVKSPLCLSQAVHSALSHSAPNGSQSHEIISYWTWPTLFSPLYVYTTLPRTDFALYGKMRYFLVLQLILSQPQSSRSGDTVNIWNNGIHTDVGYFISDHILVVIHSPMRNVCVIENRNNEEFLEGEELKILTQILEWGTDVMIGQCMFSIVSKNRRVWEEQKRTYCTLLLNRP